jgi:hypothetical protein
VQGGGGVGTQLEAGHGSISKATIVTTIKTRSTRATFFICPSLLRCPYPLMGIRMTHWASLIYMSDILTFDYSTLVQSLHLTYLHFIPRFFRISPLDFM